MTERKPKASVRDPQPSTSPDASESFAKRVLSITRRVPYGRVTSYGDIATLAGFPRAARGVGRILGSLPAGSDVPWWRVIRSTGAISAPGPVGTLQAALLGQEGVRVNRGTVVRLDRHRWQGDHGPVG